MLNTKLVNEPRSLEDFLSNPYKFMAKVQKNKATNEVKKLKLRRIEEFN